MATRAGCLSGVLLQGKGLVQAEAQVLNKSLWGGGNTEVHRPPFRSPVQGGLSEEHDFSLPAVELKKGAAHPIGNSPHTRGEGCFNRRGELAKRKKSCASSAYEMGMNPQVLRSLAKGAI